MKRKIPFVITGKVARELCEKNFEIKDLKKLDEMNKGLNKIAKKTRI